MFPAHSFGRMIKLTLALAVLFFGCGSSTAAVAVPSDDFLTTDLPALYHECCQPNLPSTNPNDSLFGMWTVFIVEILTLVSLIIGFVVGCRKFYRWLQARRAGGVQETRDRPPQFRLVSLV